MKLNDDIKNICKGKLAAYISLVSPDNYTFPKHIDFMIKKLEAVERGDINRLMVFMPPRHGKSELCSHYFPTWFIGKHPDKQIIFTTYAQELADTFGRKVRNSIAEPVFSDIFGVALSGDNRASDKFSTDKGGIYIAVGAGGSITGRGGHLIIIDDPVKGRLEADSKTTQRRVQEWYTSVLYSRLMPESSIILVQTRWHENDLAGFILRENKHENWDVVSFPALAEQDDALGRITGDALWPDQFPIDALENIKLTIEKTGGGREWNSLYQQRPVPLSGGMIKFEWFKRYSALPSAGMIIQSIDSASSGKDLASFSVVGTWVMTETGFYLADVWRMQVEYPELEHSVIAQIEKWNPSVVLIENKSTGQALIPSLRKKTRVSILPINPRRMSAATGDAKEVRMSVESPAIESGRLFLPERAQWLSDYESELTSFPLGLHNDQVDMTSQFLCWARMKQASGHAGVGMMKVSR